MYSSRFGITKARPSADGEVPDGRGILLQGGFKDFVSFFLRFPTVVDDHRR